MTWPWKSPAATDRAITDRAKDRFPPREIARRQREVAYRRLLARLFADGDESWVVKGGVALLLRLDPNRTSNDIDLAYVAEAGEHAVALQALEAAAARDLGDFFTFAVQSDELADVDPDHPLERAITVPVVARLGQKVHTEFHIDLVLPSADAIEVEWVQPEASLTGLPEVDGAAPIALLALPAQLADKLCAMYERHGPKAYYSSRPRDLADIAMIAQQKDVDGTSLLGHVRREEKRRRDAGTLQGPLPARLELPGAQLSAWAASWPKATRNAPLEINEALEAASLLLDPVLSGAAEGMTWVAAQRGWR